MLLKRLSRLPTCQPTEAKRTRPPLPTRLVSFLFDLGGAGLRFCTCFLCIGIYCEPLGFSMVASACPLGGGRPEGLPFTSKEQGVTLCMRGARLQVSGGVSV